MISMLNNAANANFRQQVIDEHGSVDAYLDAIIPAGLVSYIRFAAKDIFFGTPLIYAACLLIWSWLTVLTLLVFGISMRRHRISRVHVVRCVIYSSDVFVWVGLLATATLIAAAFMFWQRAVRAPTSSWAIGSSIFLTPGTAIAVFLTCLFLAGVFFTYRLGVAYRNYLKFDRPFLTALASQVIAVLFVNAVFSIASRINES